MELNICIIERLLDHPNLSLNQMATTYKSFRELLEREVEGRDYRIRMELRDPRVIIMVPHGGNIEPMTTEIAEAIAGDDYSLSLIHISETTRPY